METENKTGTYLSIRWGISRGRDTYGYNVVTLTDQTTGKKYRAKGGGYDMTGTVFGEWLQDAHQDALRVIAHCAAAYYDGTGNGYTARAGERWQPSNRNGLLYGMTEFHDGRIVLDGACGIESMTRVAEAIGLELTRTYKTSGRNRGETTGWVVA